MQACQTELADIQRLNEELGPKGVVFLGFDDESDDTMAKFIKANGYNFPTLLDPKHAVHEAYGVTFAPTEVIIGGDEKIRAYYIGAQSEDELRRALTLAGLKMETAAKPQSFGPFGMREQGELFGLPGLDYLERGNQRQGVLEANEREAHMKRVTVFLLGLTGLAVAAPSGGDLSVEEILEKVSVTYKDLQSFHFVAKREFLVSGAFGGFSGSQPETDLAEAKPGKLRLDVNRNDPQKEILFVSNGETTWTYIPSKNEYTEEAAASIFPEGGVASPAEERTDRLSGEPTSQALAEGGARLGSLTNPDPLTLARLELLYVYRGLSQQESGAQLQGKDHLKIKGQKIECYVISLQTSTGVRKLWVDETRFIVLREEIPLTVNGNVPGSGVVVKSLKEADIGLLPDGLFEFVPPKKSKLVPSLGLPGERVNLTGLEAPDFALRDLGGEKVRLSDLRGKVVVLDFWASWCRPCREGLPALQKLQNEYGSEVAIWGIDDEDARTAQGFLKDNSSSLPTLIDSKHAVHRLYGVKAIPTVIIIDRNGKVVADFVGARDEAGLRSGLRDAGLKEESATKPL